MSFTSACRRLFARERLFRRGRLARFRHALPVTACCVSRRKRVMEKLVEDATQPGGLGDAVARRVGEAREDGVLDEIIGVAIVACELGRHAARARDEVVGAVRSGEVRVRERMKVGSCSLRRSRRLCWKIYPIERGGATRRRRSTRASALPIPGGSSRPSACSRWRSPGSPSLRVCPLDRLRRPRRPPSRATR